MCILPARICPLMIEQRSSQTSEKISCIFFGTHAFAKVILQSLIDANYDITFVVTQPDRPVGRKQELQKPATKILAEQFGIPVTQPESLKNYTLQANNAELAICAQYGALIPQDILNRFPKGIINVHTSLLPKYRGASPIQTALRNGETTTGITIMKMDKGMDTGAILSQKKITILPDETYPELEARMAEIGANLLLETLPQYLDGSLQPQTQDDSQATKCKMISREDGKIDWQQSTQTIYNMYRAFTPWPGIWTMWGNKRLKLLSISPSEAKFEQGKAQVENTRLFIGTADKSVEIRQIQLEGKPAMNTAEFIQGYQRIHGQTLQ